MYNSGKFIIVGNLISIKSYAQNVHFNVLQLLFQPHFNLKDFDELVKKKQGWNT